MSYEHERTMRLDKLGIGVGIGFGMIVGADGGDGDGYDAYRPGACTHCKKLKVRFFASFALVYWESEDC